MKILYRFAADTIFVIHFFLVALVLFGWLTPSLWVFYMAALVATLISDFIFGYCLLSKWEFVLRKKINQEVDYDFAWATYYTYKLTNHRISNRFYTQAGITFLAICIVVNIYFKFFY